MKFAKRKYWILGMTGRGWGREAGMRLNGDSRATRPAQAALEWDAPVSLTG